MSEQDIETEQEHLPSLSNLSPAPGSRHRRKRRGIGEGSGLGKTCGRGQKGQKARSGGSIPRGFEGGQMPIHRRLPKRGFTSRKRVRKQNVFQTVALERLLALGSEEITLDMMADNGLLRAGKQRVKILGSVQVDKKLSVEAHAVSQSARAAIEGAGGEVKLVGN